MAQFCLLMSGKMKYPIASLEHLGYYTEVAPMLVEKEESAMAGSSPKKETKRQNERIVPSLDKGASRISGAAGAFNAQQMQSTRVEQRASASSKQNGRSQSSTSAKATGRTRQNGSSKGRSRKNAAPPRATPAHNGPAPDTRDVKFLRWASNRWNNLAPHHQQSIFSVLLLVITLLMFASLTVFRKFPVLSGIYKFLTTFFGWSAYVLVLGLLAFAVAHLIEGIRQQRFIRWSMVVGLACVWLLLLLESRLILGSMKVGVVAEVLINPLLGWPVLVQHVVLLGLLVLMLVIAFRITFGHVLQVGNFAQRIISSARPQASADEEENGPSRFLGQRPQYSRYGAGSALEDDEQPAATPKRQVGSLARNGQQFIEDDEDEEEDDEGNIAFESDFEEDDDPRNNINLYKQEVGLVPKGPRTPKLPISVEAIDDVDQQPLPFPQGPIHIPPTPARNGRNGSEMEPLQPNPKRVGAQARASARQVEPPINESSWKLPDLSLLHNPEEVKSALLGDDTATLARTIQETLRSFRVDAEVKPEDISIGPTVIRFGIRPTGKPEMTVDDKGRAVPVRDAGGNIVYETRTRVSRIMALQNDLALVLEAKTIRMEAPVPGRPYVGVEIPNKNSRLVTLREVLESKEYLAAKAKSKLTVALGKDVAGQVRVGDLARMPHLLIAGATGAGKSVAINVIIASILTQASPDDVRMLMVDPKMVELNMYNNIPHLLSPVVIEVDKVVSLLTNAIKEMERRYRLFSQLGVRNLDGYRKMRAEKLAKGDTSLANMPAIVIIIDELADLMMAAPEEVEGMICRLAQLARATGIHLVIATQRPSVDVITGLIKANIPTRISFMVSSAVDSRTIIDMGGAERLLGRGDMLYLPADAGRPERIQCAFLADDEAETLVQFWRQQVTDRATTLAPQGVDPALASTTPVIEPGWELKEQTSDDFELDDDLLDEAEEVVREYGKASISLLQRRLRIGYSRAARLIDLLEERGIIGHSEQGGRAREVFDDERRSNHSEGSTMSDIANEIVAEEKARDEFLKKQAGKLGQHNQDE